MDEDKEFKEFNLLKEELIKLRKKKLFIENRANDIRKEMKQNKYFHKENMFFGTRCDFCLGSVGDGYYNGLCKRCNNF